MHLRLLNWNGRGLSAAWMAALRHATRCPAARMVEVAHAETVVTAATAQNDYPEGKSGMESSRHYPPIRHEPRPSRRHGYGRRCQCQFKCTRHQCNHSTKFWSCTIWTSQSYKSIHNGCLRKQLPDATGQSQGVRNLSGTSVPASAPPSTGSLERGSTLASAAQRCTNNLSNSKSSRSSHGLARRRWHLGCVLGEEENLVQRPGVNLD